MALGAGTQPPLRNRVLRAPQRLGGAGLDRMIAPFTDFGLHGPYTDQMKAVLHQMAPGMPVIDLFADAPVGNPRASAYLLAAYAAWFPVRTVFLCVVDPGVGGTRPSIFLEADDRWFIGPGNGLFELDPAPCPRDAQLGHRLEAEAPLAAFTGATSSPRWQPCWRAVIRPPAGHITMAEIAGRLAG